MLFRVLRLISFQTKFLSTMLPSNSPMANSAEVLPDSLHRLLKNGHLERMLSNDQCPSLLFMRHSDRPALPPNTAGANVSLTPQGVLRARHFGNSLRLMNIQPGASLICSPVTRNIQTINEICLTAGWTDHVKRVEMNQRIFGPGTIYDEGVNIEDVVRGFVNHKLDEIHEIFHLIVNGRENLFYAIKPFEEGARNLISTIIETLSHPDQEKYAGGLSIMVSHDVMVAYLLAKCFGMKSYTASTWPPFMDGILFQLVKAIDGNRLIAVYGDKKVEMEC